MRRRTYRRRPPQTRFRRGLTMIEVLAAVLIVSIAAVGAIATWALSTKVTATKRVTDMASYVSIQEIERLKAIKYSQLSYTTSANVEWYDKYGNWLGDANSSPAVNTGYYEVQWTVISKVSRYSTTSDENLAEVEVKVYDTTGTTLYEDIQTLLTFGGI